jgi:hypothetical protein
MFEFVKKIIKENKPWSIVLIIFIVVPIVIQMHWWPIYQITKFLTPGNHDTWVQFWGSYLGIISSALVAYGVARYQIQEDKKNREILRKSELLPYFNIDEKGIIFSTQDGTLPLAHIVVKVFTQNGNEYTHNIGHKFPNSYFTTGPNQSEKSTFDDLIEPNEVEFKWMNGHTSFGVGSRMDISAQLVDGRRVFFTYGDNVNGAHFVISDHSNCENYVEETGSKQRAEAEKRVKDYLINNEQ